MKHFLNTTAVNNFLLPSSRAPAARNFLKAAAASISPFLQAIFQRMFSKHYGEQDSFLVGCVPPSGQPCQYREGKFKQVSSDDHKMSVAEEGVGYPGPMSGGILKCDLSNDAFDITYLPPTTTMNRQTPAKT